MLAVDAQAGQLESLLTEVSGAGTVDLTEGAGTDEFEPQRQVEVLTEGRVKVCV